MPSRLLVLVFSIVLLPTLSGCDATSTTTDPEYVVQSYLIAEEPLPLVRVSHSIPADETYDSDAAAVEGATIIVRRLDDQEEVDASYSYTAIRPGVYRPVTSGEVVVPGTTYRLEVQPPDGSAPIHATTTVPEAFEVVRTANTTTEYQSDDQPSVTLTRSEDAGRQNVYVFTIMSLLDFENTPAEELQDELTPFLADAFDADEDDIEDERVNSSPLFNEANYDVNPDGTLTIDLPWIAIAFYGPNRVTINVPDDNLYDLIRTHTVQQGGLSPGEIPNVIEHVEGGAGIFGSYARQAVDVEVQRSPEAP